MLGPGGDLQSITTVSIRYPRVTASFEKHVNCMDLGALNRPVDSRPATCSSKVCIATFVQQVEDDVRVTIPRSDVKLVRDLIPAGNRRLWKPCTVVVESGASDLNCELEPGVAGL